MKEYRCRLGESISDHYASMVKMAKAENSTYYFEANDIIFIADKDSDEKLVDKWLSKAYTYHLKVIGPDEPMMTDEYIRKTAEENRIREEEMKARWKKEEEEEAADMKLVEEYIKDSDYIFKKDKKDVYEEWLANNQDSYGKVCFDYANKIARYLQVSNPLGDYDKSAVRRGEHLIRQYGITGFQHGAVKSILRETWELYNESMFD